MEGFLTLISRYFNLFWENGKTPLSLINTASKGEDSSILGTNEMFGDPFITHLLTIETYNPFIT